MLFDSRLFFVCSYVSAVNVKLVASRLPLEIKYD